MSQKRIGTKYTYYRNITIEKEDADKIDMSSKYFLNKGFIIHNHQTGPNDIIGEPTKLYKENNELKLNFKLYNDALIRKTSNPIKNAIELIDRLIPSISCKILEKDNEGKITKCELISVSLGISNVDPTIENLYKQTRTINNKLL